LDKELLDGIYPGLTSPNHSINIKILFDHLRSKSFANNRLLNERLDEYARAYNDFFLFTQNDCLIFGNEIHSQFNQLKIDFDQSNEIKLARDVLAEYISLHLLYSDTDYLESICDPKLSSEQKKNFIQNNYLFEPSVYNLQKRFDELFNKKPWEAFDKLSDKIHLFLITLLQKAEGKEILLEERIDEIKPFYFLPEDSREVIERAKSRAENKIYSNNHETKK